MLWREALPLMKSDKINDKPALVAYCGLYCGDCPGHTQRVADLAQELGKELRQGAFDKLSGMLAAQPGFQVFKDYETAYEVIVRLGKLRCQTPCRARKAGETGCTISPCCEDRGLAGCWECADFERCSRLEGLSATHGDAHIRNLRILKKRGVAGFIRSKRHWYSEPGRSAARRRKPRPD
jgi:hypothetical protein